MELKRVACLLSMLALVLLAAPVFAEPALEVPAAPALQGSPPQEAAQVSLEALLGLDPKPLYAAAGAGGRGRTQGGLSFSPGRSSETCEWYWIQCSNGASDSCCADLWNCWDYCESFCGGPCVYVPNET